MSAAKYTVETLDDMSLKERTVSPMSDYRRQ